MTRSEFLSQLRDALESDLGSSAVQENVNYYNHYISEETAKGKSEEEVLESLGDPWIIARTIIDAADGTDRATVYESGGSSYSSSGAQQNYQQRSNSGMHVFQLGTWWKKLLLILFVIMIVVLVVAVISGLMQLLAPILVPILLIMIIVRIIGGRRS